MTPDIVMKSNNGWDVSLIREIIKELPDGTIIHSNSLFCKQTIAFNLPKNIQAKVSLEKKP